MKKDILSWNDVKEKYLEFHKMDSFTENMAIDVDFGYWLVNNCIIPDVSGSLPSDEEFETALEKEAFRVPYDGSNNFYDEATLKHWRKCWEWVKNSVSNDR